MEDVGIYSVLWNVWSLNPHMLNSNGDRLVQISNTKSSFAPSFKSSVDRIVLVDSYIW